MTNTKKSPSALPFGALSADDKRLSAVIYDSETGRFWTVLRLAEEVKKYGISAEDFAGWLSVRLSDGLEYVKTDFCASVALAWRVMDYVDTYERMDVYETEAAAAIDTANMLFCGGLPAHDVLEYIGNLDADGLGERIEINRLYNDLNRYIKARELQIAEESKKEKKNRK